MSKDNLVYFSASFRNGDYYEDDSLSGLANNIFEHRHDNELHEPCFMGMELQRHKINLDETIKVSGNRWDCFCDSIIEKFDNA